MKHILIARFVGTTQSIPTPEDGTFLVLAAGTQAAMQAQAVRLNAAITAPDQAKAQGFLELSAHSPQELDIEFAAVECLDNVAVGDMVRVAQELVEKVIAPQITQPMVATTKASSTVAAPSPKRRLGKSGK